MLLPLNRKKLTFAIVPWFTDYNSTIYLKILRASLWDLKDTMKIYSMFFFVKKNSPDNGKAETILAISETIWLTESNGFCFHKAADRTGQCSITLFKCSVKSSKFKQFIFVIDNIIDLYPTIFFSNCDLDNVHLANKSGRRDGFFCKQI